MADADARENWTVLIAFRDNLMRHKTLEAAYLGMAEQYRQRKRRPFRIAPRE